MSYLHIFRQVVVVCWERYSTVRCFVFNGVPRRRVAQGKQRDFMERDSLLIKAAVCVRLSSGCWSTVVHARDRDLRECIATKETPNIGIKCQAESDSVV